MVRQGLGVDRLPAAQADEEVVPLRNATVASMQRTATQVFVASSIAFGVIGATFFLVGLVAGFDASGIEVVFALWGLSGCVVLVSFALSVAGKYLMDDD